MKKAWLLCCAMAVALVATACVQQVKTETKVPKMTKEELRSIMNRPDVVVIDVRIDQDWAASGEKIKGAVREDPEKDVKTWASKYPKDKTLVFYCS